VYVMFPVRPKSVVARGCNRTHLSRPLGFRARGFWVMTQDGIQITFLNALLQSPSMSSLRRRKTMWLLTPTTPALSSNLSILVFKMLSYSVVFETAMTRIFLAVAWGGPSEPNGEEVRRQTAGGSTALNRVYNRENNQRHAAAPEY